MISVVSSPSYAVFCLLALALLSPGPNIHFALWPRSADFWATAALANISIDDTSSLIIYSSNNTWRPSTVACATCLTPDVRIAYAGTWHDGTHIIPTIDDDDLQTTSTTGTPPPPKLQKGKDNDKDSGKGDDGDDGDDKDDKDNDDKGGMGKGKGGGNSRRSLRFASRQRAFRRQNAQVSNPFFTPTLDGDDPGFVDTQVTVQFSFNGTSCFKVSHLRFVRRCLSIYREAALTIGCLSKTSADRTYLASYRLCHLCIRHRPDVRSAS